MSARNEESTYTSNRPIVLSDSDSDDGRVIMSRPSVDAAIATAVSSQSEGEEDLIFNSNN